MIFKQRKYCEGCECYFFFESDDSPNPSETCPVDFEHTTRDHVVLQEEGSIEGFFISSEAEKETNESDWQDVLLIPVTPEEEEIYQFLFSCELYNLNNNAVTSVRMIIDDVEYCLHNADCEVDGGDKLEKLIVGFARETLDTSTHIIKIQFKARSGTAYIRRVRCEGKIVHHIEGAGYGYGES